MRLIGSKTEREIRDMMVSSHARLFGGNQDSRLLHVLKASFPDIRTAYFLGHIIEQGEDIYTLLVDVDIVAKIEISRCIEDEVPDIEVSNVRDYRKKLSRANQITLEVAIDLAKNA